MTFLAETLSMDLMWRNALGAIPLAIVVAVLCRFVRCRASTRHALWFIVLLALLAPPLLPSLDFSDELGATRFFAQMVQPVAEPAAPPPPAADLSKSSPKIPSSTDSSASIAPDASDPDSPPFSTLESAASTASERSPTSLSESASRPNPSLEHTVAIPPSPVASQAASQSIAIESPRSDPSPSAATAAVRAPESQSSIDSIVPSIPVAAPMVRPKLTIADWLGKPRARDVDSSRWKATMAVSPSFEPASGEGLDATGAASAESIAPAESLAARVSAWAAAIEWRDWLTRVAVARASIVNLAPIPTSLWLAGVALIVLVMGVRIWRFRRMLHRAWPAENEVVDLVQDCADAIGLRHMPAVLMTDRPVSPLVWCGARRVLVLPDHLWADLDDTARRAVLLHELAHLKRRDHWVCWVEMVVCTLYWWNPIAWWVRSRLRDEADYCCDAWVTAVLPTGRSAYARALLTTRQYLNLNPSRTNSPVPPGLALGATSARTKRFARRLTMVMTNRSTPRLSVSGSALALLLAAGAWLGTPLWACPPEETTTNGVGPSAPQAVIVQAKPAKAPKARTSVTVPHEVVHSAGGVATTVAPVAPGSTYEQHMAARDHAPVAVAQAAPSAGGRNTIARTVQAGQAGGGDLEARMQRLEGRMDRLTAQLERLLGGGDAVRVPGQPSAPSPHAAPTPPTPPAPPAPLSPPAQARGMARSGAAAMAPAARAPGGAIARGQAPAAVAGELYAAEIAAADSGEQIVRFYPLPGDMGPALFEFMRREDVPVLVAQRDDGIEVHGTAAQHRAFAAFIMIINPQARIEGMAPVGGADAVLDRDARRALEAELAAAARSDQAQGQAENQVRNARAQIEKARKAQADELKRASDQQRKQMDQQRKQMDQQRKQLQKQSEELRKKAEEMQRKAEELRAKAEKLEDGGDKDQLDAQADAIEAQADSLEAQADAQEEAIDAQIEAMEAQLEAQEEALEEQLEAQAEAMEAQMEAEIEALEAHLAAAEDAKATPPATPSPR